MSHVADLLVFLDLVMAGPLGFALGYWFRGLRRRRVA